MRPGLPTVAILMQSQMPSLLTSRSSTIPLQSLSRPSQISGDGEHWQTLLLWPPIVPQFQPAMQSDVLPQVVVHTFVPVLSGMQIPPGQLELSAHPLAPAAPPPPLEPLAPARPVVTIAGSVDELPPLASPPPPPPTDPALLRPSQYCLRQDHFDTRQPRWLSPQ